MTGNHTEIRNRLITAWQIIIMKKGIAYAIPFIVCVILSLFTNLLLLLSKTKLLDKCSVTLDILALKVCEKVSSLTYHLKKTSS